ncbi:MAG: cytochrome c-type biogenesis protein CcmH [Myxococcota bacterium]
MVCLGLGAHALGSSTALAQARQETPAPGSDRAKTLYTQLSSPFCRGKTLDGCTSPAAAEWRQDIRRWVAEGVSSEEIKERLSARAGGADLIAAPTSGFSHGWLVFSVVGSIALLGFALRRMMARREDRSAAEDGRHPTDEDAPIDEEYDRRLNDELALLE